MKSLHQKRGFLVRRSFIGQAQLSYQPPGRAAPLKIIFARMACEQQQLKYGTNRLVYQRS